MFTAESPSPIPANKSPINTAHQTQLNLFKCGKTYITVRCYSSTKVSIIASLCGVFDMTCTND